MGTAWGHLTVEGAGTKGSGSFVDPGIRGRKEGRASSEQAGRKGVPQVPSSCQEAPAEALKRTPVQGLTEALGPQGWERPASSLKLGPQPGSETRSPWAVRSEVRRAAIPWEAPRRKPV